MLIAFMLTLCGCRKDRSIDDGRTSYTFVNMVAPLSSWNINAWIYEYDSANVRIDSNYIASPEYNKDYTFYPSEACHHLTAKVFSPEKDRWSPDVFLIRPGRNIRIEVSLSTPYAFKEPEYHAQ